ncbi:ABC transporter ATP-binding protein [Limnohabitans sp. MMS-10A-160]|uniref:ABC transporter ATP-binding protein n=1 Tax=unclassified Limnohabitans TaxID=2626134 RepID=UPI000D334906|nr:MULTISPECIES: ABC transporter ATP-binding protein [unclassified Limnohabitans]PUE22561.1 ABC transporter ATP-binding protein [Limnohabitans sp. MMS-10A-192]PUE22613.1 ABC transporter ATP-binding protein [Limnohabitans sp. MMS-10A-160]
MQTTILSVSNLSASYGPIRALRGVSLEVKEGETVAVVGANGAGKTSLMRALSGILPLSGGSATFDGIQVGKAKAHQLARAGMLHVPEGRGTLQTMRVRENLQLAWEIRPTEEPLEKALQNVYARFPRLAERSEQLAGNLSGGEQQMLSVARAIINRPRLLLLDEPSMGLSPLFTQEVFKALAEIRNAGVSILIVEQNVSKALELAHRAMVLSHGEITLQGPAKELASDPRVMASYMGQE